MVPKHARASGVKIILEILDMEPLPAVLGLPYIWWSVTRLCWGRNIPTFPRVAEGNQVEGVVLLPLGDT